jgi:galactose mutarotase-like enzyme
MNIQIDKDNFVIISPETGGRILHLVLSGHTIIRAHKPYNDNGSGNFLMFPWISKAP